jgi:hypothetical protein
MGHTRRPRDVPACYLIIVERSKAGHNYSLIRVKSNISFQHSAIADSSTGPAVG